MEVPDSSLYKDINSETEFVDFKMGAIQHYLVQMDKSLDTDAENLYKEKFLKYIRLAASNNIFFVKSECHAQMKRSVSYKIDIAIDCDGCIIESQCECAAGMGPSAHCKHVCCLLLALYNFSSNGDILTEETCTQRLQTFHHSKPYKGSPLKASCLPLNVNRVTEVTFDPRPLKYRKKENYPDYFRTICLNYSRISSFPISQLYPPANIYGVASDHDYLKETPENMWLKTSNITHICDDEIKHIEENTKGQSKNIFWKQERCKRLQASNYGRICKATDKTNFKNLAESLTVMKELKTSAILHGHKYEDVALRKYESVTGRGTRQCGIFVSPTHPFIGASPDSIVNEKNIVEIKCPFVVKDKLITNQTVPYLVAKDGTLELDITHNYYYQIQGQLFCTGAVKCDLVVYTFKDLKIIPVRRNDAFIEHMLTKLTHFYHNYFREAVLKRFFYKDVDKYSFD